MSDRQKRPLSKARLAANRANAQKSTGPQTPEGKLRSSANACQHGFAASLFAVVRLENPADIDAIKAGLVATYQPINPAEMLAIERAALAQNSIFRAYRLESGMLTAGLDGSLDRRTNQVLYHMAPEMIGGGEWTDAQRLDITRAQNRNFALGLGFHQFVQKGDSWPLLLRYKTHADRSFRRAIEDLERLISMRGELAVPQAICEQPAAQPDPVCAPHELNPSAFRPPAPDPVLRNEPTSGQPTETKPVSSNSTVTGDSRVATETAAEFPPGQ